ncbi:MAG TPA: hypothetical protein P5102_16645 [Candidatus Competibacteraceae bacterium]|nr:hypothetical protein [Candidatus Competibacteraceae bacterium]HSA47883.1 hypothetical protein [Candidatus Competibacteraceae bacterium]
MMKLKLKAVFLTVSLFTAVLLAISALDFWVVQPAFKKIVGGTGAMAHPDTGNAAIRSGQGWICI